MPLCFLIKMRITADVRIMKFQFRMTFSLRNYGNSHEITALPAINWEDFLISKLHNHAASARLQRYRPTDTFDGWRAADCLGGEAKMRCPRVATTTESTKEEI